MKKYLFLAGVAAMMLAACAKVVPGTNEAQNEVSFQVANYVETKANVAYDTGNTFGTYAWFNAESGSGGSTNAVFMVNEPITYVDPVWKANRVPFYWPKSGTLEFISYSPFAGTANSAGTVPVVTRTTITYNDATAANVDYMYADKAICTNADHNNQTPNITVDTSDPGFRGVPTLFHHALAKLAFQIKANFLQDDDTNPTTYWAVTVEEFKVSGLYQQGDLALTLDTDGKTWKLPDNKVWSDPASPTAAQELVPTPTAPATGLVLTTDYQDLSALTNTYILPQELKATDDTDPSNPVTYQRLHLKLKIVTTLSNSNTITEYFVKDYDLKELTSLTYLEMNKNIVFKINIKPTAYATSYTTPTDVVIHFDPAVVDWVTEETGVTIEI